MIYVSFYVSECADTDGSKCAVSGWDAHQKSQEFCAALFLLHEVSTYIIFSTRDSNLKFYFFSK